MASTRSDRLLLALLVAGCQEYTLSGEPPSVDPEDVTDCGFTPIEGTDVSRYDCNPVFSKEQVGREGQLGAVSFHAQEVLGVPFYQMWYVFHPTTGRPWTVNYAISADGVTWEDHPDNPAAVEPTRGQWDDEDLEGLRVVWDPERAEYVFLYQGLNFSQDVTKLGAYASDDGVVWHPTPNSPILDLTGTTGATDLCWPLGLSKQSDGLFAGYIAGGPPPGAELSSYVCQILRFTTPDIRDSAGYDLVKRPVLEAGPERYDKQGMIDAAVVEFRGRYLMFYVGFRKWTDSGEGWITATDSTLNLATSDDGVTWVKDPANPIPIQASESGRISAVAAQVVGDRVHLWVTDWYADRGEQAIGYFLYEPPAEE